MRYSFDDASAAHARSTQFYAMLGSRALCTTAGGRHQSSDLSGWSHFNDDEWELYHTEVDRSELHNSPTNTPTRCGSS